MTPGMAAWVIPAWFASLIFAGLAGAWIAWPAAFDRGFEDAGYQERHRHRIGDPQVPAAPALPLAGRLALEPPERLEPLPAKPPRPQPAPEPEPAWTFFGAQDEPGPAPPAEYALMTRRTVTVEAAVLSRDTAPGETPSAWNRRQARQLARDIDEMIAASEQARQKLVEENNYFQHALRGPR